MDILEFKINYHIRHIADKNCGFHYHLNNCGLSLSVTCINMYHNQFIYDEVTFADYGYPLPVYFINSLVIGNDNISSLILTCKFHSLFYFHRSYIFSSYYSHRFCYWLLIEYFINIWIYDGITLIIISNIISWLLSDSHTVINHLMICFLTNCYQILLTTETIWNLQYSCLTWNLYTCRLSKQTTRTIW